MYVKKVAPFTYQEEISKWSFTKTAIFLDLLRRPRACPMCEQFTNPMLRRIRQHLVFTHIIEEEDVDFESVEDEFFSPNGFIYEELI